MKISNSTSQMLRKGTWTKEEDNLLLKCIEVYGEGKWNQVPKRAGLNRCRKSCRLRWLNYLRPNIKRGDFDQDEIDLILRMHKLLGNRWSLIAGRLPGRTANDVKNYWNTHLQKKLMIINPQEQALENKQDQIDEEYHTQELETNQEQLQQDHMVKNYIVKPRPRTFTNPTNTTTLVSGCTSIYTSNSSDLQPAKTTGYDDGRNREPSSNIVGMTLQTADDDHDVSVEEMWSDDFLKELWGEFGISDSTYSSAELHAWLNDEFNF